MSLSTYNSALADDIHEITIGRGGYKPYFLFSTKLHTELKTLDENDGVVIMSHDIIRNYKENEFDQSTIDFMIKPGTWLYDVYPYAENLEVTLTQIKQHRLFGGSTGVWVEERFKIVYLPDANTDIPTEPKAPRSVLNQQTPIYVRFQLVSRSTMAIRITTTQGVYCNRIHEENNDMKGDSLLKSIMSHELNKLEIEGKPVINALDIEPSKNNEPMNRILIPTGTNLMQVPFLIQEQKGGMYPAGMGCYVQRYTPDPALQPADTMFVYSLYDGSKYNDTEQRVIFFIPPDGSHNSASRTYVYEGGLLKVLTNPIPGLYDVKNNSLRSQGEGFRTASALSMITKPVELKELGPFFSQRGLVTEVTSMEQKDGLNNATYEGISDNHFVNASNVLARKGSYVQLVVDNLDPDYIFPGSSCKLLNEPVEGVLLKLEGVIHKVVVKYYYQNSEGLGEYTLIEHALVSKTFIDVFITNVEEQQSF